jgi:sugar/nucleoside kinase (ribokinase family)
MATSFQKQFGAEPIAVTSYGSDLLPYLPKIKLLPGKPNQANTLIYENDSSTGRRTQKCYNLDSAIPPEITPEIISALATADIVVVGTLLPNYPADYLRELLSYAKGGALKVLCPQGYFRRIDPEGHVEQRDFEEALDIVPMFDLIMYSEEDYPQAFELAKSWKQTMATEVIVTQSAQGATIIGKDKDIHVPTKPIAPEDIVDSVGCGDTFAAAVTYSYYDSRDLSVAILDGHQAAAKKLLTTPTKN